MTELAMKKPCIVCSEAIHADAKKCIHCDSFQNWKRHVTGSHLLLSLLVALVSVLSIGVPVIVEALKVEDSDVEVHITYARKSRAWQVDQQKNTYEIGFFLTNKGERPAALRNAAIKLKNSPVWTNLVLYPGVDGEKSMVVQSGEARMLIAHLFYNVETISSGPFNFRVDVMNFNSGEKSVIVDGKPMGGGWTAFH